MAKSKIILLTAFAVGMLAVSATAVAQKSAYVSSEAILDRYPDAKDARAKLAEFQGSWMREIERQEQERAKLIEEMQTNRLLWSPQERKDAEARLRDIETKLAAFRAAKFGPNGEFEQKQKELMGPVFDNIQKAIEEVAQTQKYDFVFDKSSRGLPLLFGNPSYDITVFVLKRLGVEVDESEIPKQPSAADAENDARRNRTRRDGTTDPNELLNPENPPK